VASVLLRGMLGSLVRTLLPVKGNIFLMELRR
jgi:hypothetical protein